MRNEGRLKMNVFGDRKRASIGIGGVYVSQDPCVVRTVLGSCISVCLRDPISRVGGMNHFMLPDSHSTEGECTRYGVHAMEMLINACMSKGAERSRLEAKVFGGGHVLKTSMGPSSVPQRNIAFTLQFLELERIRILSKDLGGLAARSVFFFTDTGQVLIKRLRETGADVQRELQEESKVVKTQAPQSDLDDILF